MLHTYNECLLVAIFKRMTDLMLHFCVDEYSYILQNVICSVYTDNHVEHANIPNLYKCIQLNENVLLQFC